MSDSWRTGVRAHEPSPSHEPSDLAEFYGRDALEFLVLDPVTAFAYWEVTPTSRSRAAEQFDEGSFSRTRLLLRVFVLEPEPRSFVELDVSGPVRSWYLELAPGRRYRAELGFGDESRFVAAVRSREFATPPQGFAPADPGAPPLEPLYERILRAADGWSAEG